MIQEKTHVFNHPPWSALKMQKNLSQSASQYACFLVNPALQPNSNKSQKKDDHIQHMWDKMKK